MGIQTRPTLVKLAPIGVRDGTHRRFSIGRNGEISLYRKFSIFASDIPKIVKYFVGWSYIDTDTPARLRRVVALRDNKDTTFSATNVSLLNEHKFKDILGANPEIPGNRTTNPSADGGVDVGFLKADIEVTYSRLMYRTLADDDALIMPGETEPVTAFKEYNRYTELQELRPASTVLTLPGHVMQYLRKTGQEGSGPVFTIPHGRTIPYNLPKIFPLMELRIVWHQLPADALPFSSPNNYLKRLQSDPYATTPTKSYKGTVNKGPFLGFPHHTLLLNEWIPVPKPATCPLMNLQNIEWDIHYSFLFDPNRHTWKYFNHVIPKGSPTGTINQSGFYFVSVKDTWYPPDLGNGVPVTPMPDETSIHNERPFTDLFLLP